MALSRIIPVWPPRSRSRRITCAAVVEIAAQRWRGKYGGEIDLIARDGERVVFIEVKRARTHAQAAERLSQRQMLRILRSAEEFLANEGCDEKTDVGYDLALVDGGGQIEVLENALYLN